MLTDPKAPRRDARGRDVYEVWADMVLANPATEIARVMAEILPKDVTDASNQSAAVSIQSLYLTAVRAANERGGASGEMKTVEGSTEPPPKAEALDEW